MTDRILHTKFGTAKIQSRGYYRITSGKEGKRIKTSYSISILVKWFKEHFPNEKLKMEV